jgi:hypothetical protein
LLSLSIPIGQRQTFLHEERKKRGWLITSPFYLPKKKKGDKLEARKIEQNLS